MSTLSMRNRDALTIIAILLALLLYLVANADTPPQSGSYSPVGVPSADMRTVFSEMNQDLLLQFGYVFASSNTTEDPVVELPVPYADRKYAVFLQVDFDSISTLDVSSSFNANVPRVRRLNNHQFSVNINVGDSCFVMWMSVGRRPARRVK